MDSTHFPYPSTRDVELPAGEVERERKREREREREKESTKKELISTDVEDQYAVYQ